MSNPEPVLMGRKRPLPACPNPLFLKWLTELRDEASEKGHKIQYTYQKAISSLNKYPLPLRDAKEAKILQNFGDGICKILDSKMQQHYRKCGENVDVPREASPPNDAYDESSGPSMKGEKKAKGVTKRKKKEYAPQKGSGGYAVLLTLYRHSQKAGSKGFMFKMELQAQAQHLCDKSFTVPELGSKYAAWSAVATLIKRNLLMKTHNPARYSLTEEGVSLARRLDLAACASKAALEDEDDEDEEESCPVAVDLTVSDEEDDNVEDGVLKSNGRRLLAGTFDIVLCVDVSETTGGSRHCKQELVTELQRSRVSFDVRKLHVGDFLWVAREKVTPAPDRERASKGRELVLDYIIERKRMDDLCGSIIDGRFREQKFRLKRCGLRRPIYLVEGHGKAASHLSLPEMTLRQAIANTQVVDGFFVKRVRDVKESAAYLAIMTRHLTRLYQKRTLVCHSRELNGDLDRRDDGALLSFAEFNYGAIKNKSQTVREAFARQLMQVSGLSADKAAAILERYSTPHSLLTAYGECASEAGKEKLLSTIRCGRLNRLMMIAAGGQCRIFKCPF
ncbi:structure-specific endonuclease subunit MUS81 isoform X2 [Vanacampus margaritifer]